jgi:hypothetical protein
MFLSFLVFSILGYEIYTAFLPMVGNKTNKTAAPSDEEAA